MKFALRTLLFVSSLAAVAAQAQITQFQHIIIVFQENRTPDNLFNALCASFPCSTTDNTQYNISTSNWLDKTSMSGVTQPTGVALNNGYDPDHSHTGWKNECDLNSMTNQCRMDGAAATSKNRGAFVFVNNTPDKKHPSGILTSYVTLATQYGWANSMFQTNQGPSFPAHQFIFGGTSAFDASGDNNGTFISENFLSTLAGCYAPDGATNKYINSAGVETQFTVNYAQGVSACLTRPTMADLLDGASLGWKYYSSKGGGADGGGSIWTAPNAIQAICVPDSGHQNCTGTEWANHVDLTPAHVLTDLSGCKLQAVNWVIPKSSNSDHPGGSTGGPDWVASVVNALGGSKCTDSVNGKSLTYWQDTAVVIAWDDFGGWYDHVPPQILPFPEGGYQLGFRVPMIFVSAYTPVGYINNDNNDFGSVLRFIEKNFALPGGEGALGFADARSTTDLTPFYNLSNPPRSFVKVPTKMTARDYLKDKTPSEDVDDE